MSPWAARNYNERTSRMIDNENNYKLQSVNTDSEGENSRFSSQLKKKKLSRAVQMCLG